ncbi:intermembrane transport protein PqiB [Rudaea cellulosilytica]|uniref:PqiB family protein n=1 Tax=Rudaea cellulosilytica TaxID=540746 RepID=UPI00036CE362|nr:MlaD family protein [Rudaea cellulosilytica]
MSEEDVSAAPSPPSLPRVSVTRRRRWSAGLIWIVPAIAALIGIGMVIHNWASEGPVIEISFITAEGLEAGKTQVKYKDVVIGLVDSIRLARDNTHVVARVNLSKDAAGFATADARYWVVRPRFGTSGVSGIGTLLSGAYIGADNGESHEAKKSFVGLERPPAVIHGSPGKRFTLAANDIGSLDIGSPVYYRRIQVGRLASYELDKDGRQMRVDIFVDAPYDGFVTVSSRFWNASGVDLNLDASGLKLNTQSLATVIAGGIAFQTPPGPRDATLAAEGAQFTLYDDMQTAFAPPDGEPDYLQMRFPQSLRGLGVGSQVDFRGIIVGRVVSINLDYDIDKQSFLQIVGVVIYPNRFGRAAEKFAQLAQDNNDTNTRLANFIKPQIARGLRAQARVGNLLTGQLYIALDFVPKAPKVEFDASARSVELPTVPGSFDRLQEEMTGIVEKLDRIPFESIGKNLDSTIARLDKTLRQVNESTLPQFSATLTGAQGTLGSAQRAVDADSPLQQNLAQTLAEMQRAARSVRVLTDYLGVHPETLLRGKPADPALRNPTEQDAKGNKP